MKTQTAFRMTNSGFNQVSKSNHTLRLRVRGEEDFKAGKPIDAFYDLPLKQHTELDRGRYELGWRAAELAARGSRAPNS